MESRSKSSFFSAILMVSESHLRLFSNVPLVLVVHRRIEGGDDLQVSCLYTIFPQIVVTMTRLARVRGAIASFGFYLFILQRAGLENTG